MADETVFAEETQSEESTPSAPAQSEECTPAAPPKKDRKALTIALAVFSIVVFAGIGLVIFNGDFGC